MLQCFILLKVEGRFSQWRAWVNRRCLRAWELQNLRSTVVCPQMGFDMVMGENRTCLLPVRYTLPRIDFSFLQHICLRFIKVACWSSERSMCGSFYLWASRVNFQHEDPNCCFNFCSFEPAQTLSATSHIHIHTQCVFGFCTGINKGSCFRINHFPEDNDYDTDSSEYILRKSLQPLHLQTLQHLIPLSLLFPSFFFLNVIELLPGYLMCYGMSIPFP